MERIYEEENMELSENRSLAIRIGAGMRDVGCGMLFSRAFIDEAHYPWQLFLAGSALMALGSTIHLRYTRAARDDEAHKGQFRGVGSL